MKKIVLQPLAESTLVETGGTLLSGLLRKDLNVLMSCGGKGLCSTCHVWVKRGMDQLSPVNSRERRTLKLVADARPESRLACQCTVFGEGVEVEVPEGMYIESADDLIALLGTRANQNLLHPITGAILIPKGKLITRTLLEQSRGVEAEVQRVRAGAPADATAFESSAYKSFSASRVGPRPSGTTQSVSRTVPIPGQRADGTTSGSGVFPSPLTSRTLAAPPPVGTSSGVISSESRSNPSSKQPPQSTHHREVSSLHSPVPEGGGAVASAVASPVATKTMAAPQPGTQIGKYLLIECIGTGGAGMVYRALHTKLKTPVAVKFIRPDVLAEDPDALARFTREAQLLAQLSHPNVVRVLDFEDDPQRPFVVMEFVDGFSAADLIKQSGRVAPVRAVEIVSQILEGLDAARRLGVVHRDVKPGNILLTRDGSSKLVDLGLAVVTTKADGEKIVVESNGPAEGTVGYMAPEQAMGTTVDHRSDQYSLGCTLYHLLTGRLPFIGRSAQEMLLQHIRMTAIHPHEVAPGVPLTLSRVVMTMMEKSPDDRYPDYASLRADLADVFRE